MGFLDKAKNAAQQAMAKARAALAGRPSTPTEGPGGDNAPTGAPPASEAAPTAHTPTQTGLPGPEAAPASSPQATDAQSVPPPAPGEPAEAGDEREPGQADDERDN